MAPQPEAFITMASTRPSRTSGHHASMLARICASAASCSSRWKLTAPQQPAPARCARRCPAHPARGWWRRRWWASWTAARSRPASAPGARARPPAAGGPDRGARAPCGAAPAAVRAHGLAQAHRGTEQRRQHGLAQQLALGALGQERGTRSSTILRPISIRCPYCTPDGQVVSQLRQVRQRSRCCCVDCVGSAPSSTCLIR